MYSNQLYHQALLLYNIKELQHHLEVQGFVLVVGVEQDILEHAEY